MIVMLSTGKTRSWVGVALVLAMIFARANEFGQHVLGLTALQSRDVFWWPLIGVLVLYVLIIERRGLASLGLRAPNWKTFTTGLLVALIWIFVLDPCLSWIIAHIPSLPRPNDAPAQTIDDLPFWYRVLLILRASVAEELVFRAFLQCRIRELTGSRLLGVGVSLAAFTFAHLNFWGITALIGVALAGLLLSLLYLWRRDLFSNVIAHYIMDVAAILI